MEDSREALDSPCIQGTDNQVRRTQFTYETKNNVVFAAVGFYKPSGLQGKRDGKSWMEWPERPSQQDQT